MFTENKIQFTIGVNIDEDEISGVEAMIRLLQDLVENSKKAVPTKKKMIKNMIKNSEVTKIETDSESEGEKEEVIEPINTSDKVKNLLTTMTKKVEGVVERDAPNCFTQQKDGSIECKCGSIMDKKNMSKHKKTVKHKEWVEKSYQI
jgi:hypothetical protein